MTKIYDRSILIIENENTSVEAFERKIGVGKNSLSSALRNKSSIGNTLLIKICKHYPQSSIYRIVYLKESPNTQVITLLIKMKKLFKAWYVKDWERISFDKAVFKQPKIEL